MVAALFNSAIVLPVCMQQITGLLQRKEQTAAILLILAVSFGLLLLGNIAEWAANAVAVRINQRICLRLVDRQVQDCLRSPLQSFQRRSSGDYVSAVGDVTEILQAQQLFILQSGIVSIAVTVLAMLILAAYNPWFVAITLPLMIAICGLPMLLASLAGRYIHREPAAFAAFGNYAEILIAGRRQWHFAPSDNLMRHADGLLDRLHHAQTGKWWIWNLSFNLKLTQNLVLYALTLLVGGLLYLDGTIGLGAAVAGYLLVTMLAPKFDSLYKLYNFAQASAAAYQALDQCSLPRRAMAKAGSALPEAITSLRITVNGYVHDAGQSVAIEQASLSLSDGDRCLITGPSGSGKSTLIDLLLGTLSASTAQVWANDRPLCDFGLEPYWQQVAYVPNPDLLFGGMTAAENLALYGDATMLTRANWADRLGWDRFSDTLGDALSGGERQRLALLRALSRGRSILILDEPTSALDDMHMRGMFEILAEQKGGIIIAASHSRGAERYFNRVFEMSHRRLVECT